MEAGLIVTYTEYRVFALPLSRGNSAQPKVPALPYLGPSRDGEAHICFESPYHGDQYTQTSGPGYGID